jgi:tellurite resistance protein
VLLGGRVATTAPREFGESSKTPNPVLVCSDVMREFEFIQQLTPTQTAALLEVMVLAAEADGEVAGDELVELAQNISRVTNGAVSREQASVGVESARTALAASDRATRLEFVKGSLAPAQRRHALLLAIQVTSADGRIRTSERELILQMAEALEIDGESAADLVRAVAR